MGQDLTDEEWVVRFLTAVGSDPDQFPPEFLAVAAPRADVPSGAAVLRFRTAAGRLAAARFPKLVVSGGHSAGFNAMCDALARNIRASRAVIEDAGHEIQFTGQPINEALLTLCRSAGESPPQSH